MSCTRVCGRGGGGGAGGSQVRSIWFGLYDRIYLIGSGGLPLLLTQIAKVQYFTVSAKQLL